jgi:hypothetical protein
MSANHDKNSMKTNLPKNITEYRLLLVKGQAFQMAPEQQHFVSLHETRRAYRINYVKNG